MLFLVRLHITQNTGRVLFNSQNITILVHNILQVGSRDMLGDNVKRMHITLLADRADMGTIS